MGVPDCNPGREEPDERRVPDPNEDQCDCGHQRHSHSNGLFECKWCKCKSFREPVVPNIFEE